MLNKKFWQTYINDVPCLIWKIIFLLICVTFIKLFTAVPSITPFVIGYIVCDPFSYYFINYEEEA